VREHELPTWWRKRNTVYSFLQFKLFLMISIKVISAAAEGWKKKEGKRVRRPAWPALAESFVELKHTVLEFIFLMALDALKFSS
jgi:hypothetical protein